MKRSLVLALLAGGVLAAGSAMAQSDNPPPPAPGMGDMGPQHGGGAIGGPMHHGMRGMWRGHGGPDGLFERFDLNKDGKVTKEEVETVEKRHFEDMFGGTSDVTKSEFIAAHERAITTRLGQLFDKLDANHDGKLTESEMSAMAMRIFDRFDKNHDDVITRDELPKPHWGHHGPPPSPSGGDQKPGN